MTRRVSSLLTLVALATVLPAVTAAQTVAVLPFLTTPRSAHAAATAQSLVGEAVQGFRASGRFSSVLDRSVDPDLHKELVAAQQEDHFDGPVKLSTSSLLSAQYLAVGLVEAQQTNQRVVDGKPRWNAEIALDLKLVETESGAIAHIRRVRVSSSLARQIITPMDGAEKECKGIGCRVRKEFEKRVKDRAADFGLESANSLTGNLFTDTTEADALRSAMRNAGTVLKQFAEQVPQGMKLSGTSAAPAPSRGGAMAPSTSGSGAAPAILDWGKSSKSGVFEVVLGGGAAAGLKRGTHFNVREARPGRANPAAIYNADIGEIEIVDVQADNARAKIVTGEKEIAGALEKKASNVTLVAKP